MNAAEQARFNPLYAAMLRALKLQGKAEKTIEGYSRAVRRSAEFFDRCPDDLSADELQTYFAALLESHSWSAVKIDRCGLQFFYRYVLKRPWVWTEIVKPPRPQRLPDILTRAETLRLLDTVRKRRYRVFFTLLYGTGLRLGEGLALEVGDIDAQRLRIHVRGGKGDKDRYVPITEPLLLMLRRWWTTHRHPRLIFPNPVGKPETVREAQTPMDRGGVQAALNAAVAEAGIRLHIHVHSLRHCFARPDRGHLLELGVDLRELQSILGHAHPETTA
jgi:integrase/recombinase XerD